MREIKFRAYVKDKNKIYDVKDIDFVYGFVRFEEEGKPTDTMRMFDQVELMQYTGLEDMNGKEIYEGDIVKIDNDTISEVVFDEGAFCWCEYSDGYTDGRFPHSFNDNEYYCFCEEIEVIGNVYDNPELLKGIR